MPLIRRLAEQQHQLHDLKRRVDQQAAGGAGADGLSDAARPARAALLRHAHGQRHVLFLHACPVGGAV